MSEDVTQGIIVILFGCIARQNPDSGKGLNLAFQEEKMEAPGGFEPPIEVLQTSALATWRRRPLSFNGWGKEEKWSGRRDLNPRLQPWQGCTLPLSYSRLLYRNLSAVQMKFSLYFLSGVCQTLFFYEFALGSFHQPLDVFTMPDSRDDRRRRRNVDGGSRVLKIDSEPGYADCRQEGAD